MHALCVHQIRQEESGCSERTWGTTGEAPYTRGRRIAMYALVKSFIAGRYSSSRLRPFKGCNPDVDFLHRGAIVDGWRASLSPHRGARERRGELVHRLCVQLRACRRRALGASPIRPTLADGRSPSSSISACSVFARLPCRIMDGRELSEGGTYEHPDIRHEEKLRY